MRDEEHRLPGLGLEADHLVLHVAPDERVEGAEGFVIEHQRRIHGEGAGEAHTLLHPARELVRKLVSGILEADEPQYLLGAGESFSLGHALDLESEGDVVNHPPVGEQAEVLEHHCDCVTTQLAELGAAGSHDVPAGDADLSGTRLDQPDQRPDERGLARAGEAHDHEDLAGMDLDRDVAHGDHAARLLAQLTAWELALGRSDELVAMRAEHLPDALGTDDRLAVRLGGRGTCDRRSGRAAARLPHQRGHDISALRRAASTSQSPNTGHEPRDQARISTVCNSVSVSIG